MTHLRKLGILFIVSIPRLLSQSEYNEAVAKSRAGDWATACQIAADLIAAQPSHYAGHNLLGLCAARNGDRASAERSFRRSIALNPNFADSHNNLGIELLQSGRRDDAFEQFTASLRVDSKNVTALYNLGRIELDTGNHQSAILQLSAAVKLAPDDPAIRLALSEALVLSGQESRARENLKPLLERRPEMMQQMLSLARKVSAEGRYENARALLASADPQPRYEAEWNAIAGYADYKLGNPQRAQVRLRRALELDPTVEEYWMNMGELLLFHRSFDAAVAFFAAGLGKLPESARLHLGIGVSLSAAGQDEEGIRHLETALQIRPNLEAAFSALCAAYQQRKEWRQLEQTAAQWLRQNQQAFGAYYYQAVTLIEGGGQMAAGTLPEAERLLRRSIEIEPLFSPSRVALGKLLNQRDQPAKALREFQSAVKADPRDAAAQYQLAITYRKLGQMEKSRQALQAFNKMKANEQQWNIVFQLSKNKP